MNSKLILASLIAVGASLFSVNSAQALTYTVGYDSPSDASGGNTWEIYSIGYASDGVNLYLSMNVGYQLSGIQNGGDSYSGSTPLSPGDIYINKNGSHNAGTGTVYGLAVTTHSGDMTADPSDNALPWSPVVAGHLYSNAGFVTGTYEGYDGADQFSEDGGNDPYGHANNIPTLIASYASDLGAQVLSLSLLNSGAAVQVNPNGTTRTNVWNIAATIALSSLGLSGSDTFEVWWSPECGNDTYSVRGTVPEPASLGLLVSGLLGASGVLRRKRQA